MVFSDNLSLAKQWDEENVAKGILHLTDSKKIFTALQMRLSLIKVDEEFAPLQLDELLELT